MVHGIRRNMPMLGTKKLYWLLKDKIKQQGYKIGRDKFFEILKLNGLLVRRKKRYVRTTNSNHRFKIYDNLIKDLEVTKPDELYEGDITYISTEEGYCYLAHIEDHYSRKIVGRNTSDSLELEGVKKALEMAIKGKELTGMIHHSDRGLQYCSNAYTGILKQHGILISMSEKGNPYENAVAERINGILKEEFMLSKKFKTKKDAMKAINEAIETYNNLRPHMSIGYLTPNQKYELGKSLQL
jgi:transposase InsO family protein